MAKKAFPLRVDEEVLKAVESWAASEFRSVNGQIEWILHQALLANKRLKQNDGEKPPQQDPK